MFDVFVSAACSVEAPCVPIVNVADAPSDAAADGPAADHSLTSARMSTTRPAGAPGRKPATGEHACKRSKIVIDQRPAELIERI